MKRDVLLVLSSGIPDCVPILRGIARYQRDAASFPTYIDWSGGSECNEHRLRSRPWAGVISRVTPPWLSAACAEMKLPLVDLDDSAAVAGATKIRNDNRAIGHLAAEDLYERGFRRLYFCGYPNRAWSLERRDGFFEAGRLLGLCPQEFSLPHGCGLDPDEYERVVRQIADWLQTISRPAAVLAAHDFRAAQVIAAAHAAGLGVPDDLAVMGVNNDEPLCDLSQPPLSSVATNAEGIGFVAAGELVRLLQGGAPTEREILIEPAKVITRRSTDNLAIADRAIARAIALIRQRACEGVTVDEVSRAAAVSRARLEMGFRRYLGRSPHAEIRRIQIQRVKQLLSETDLPLKDIAARTGYDHVEYLSVSFKRLVGETPGQFRRAAALPGAGIRAA